MIPQMKDIEASVCKLCGIREGDLTLSLEPMALQAVGMVAWLADQATEMRSAEVALYLGRTVSIVAAEKAAIMVRLDRDPAFADLMNEELMTTCITAEVNRRNAVPHRNLSAVDIAHAIVSSRISLMRISVDEHCALASAYLAVVAERQTLFTEYRELLAAVAQFDSDKFTPGERAARERLSKIASTLTAKSKELTHV